MRIHLVNPSDLSFGTAVITPRWLFVLAAATPERFGTPEGFFREHFVLNYCPLVWMSETGANLTPDKLRARELADVNALCEETLGAALRVLQPEHAVGIGAFAAQRLAKVTTPDDPWQVTQILHPSPASPAANRDWAGAATRALQAAGIWT